MCNQCKHKLVEFINTCLDGDIDQLKHYDFTPLGIKHRRDCDRLPVVNAMYCLLYSEHFNVTSCLLETDIFNNNCGDTLNTYKSSFENSSAGKRANLIILEALDSDSLLSLQSTFKARYNTIGNFMPLPTKTINRISINTGRNSAANDYADLFLTIVEDYYRYGLNEERFLQKYTAPNQRKGIQNLALVIVKNADYFALVENFDNFISWNHLEAFYKENRFPLFEHSLESIHFKNEEDIKNYLINATAIIEDRADSIIGALKQLLK